MAARLRPRPWHDAIHPARATGHALMLGSMKGFMTYAAALPTPELRSVEIVIDDVSGLALPPPWRRHEVEIRAGELGGVPGEWLIPRSGTARRGAPLPPRRRLRRHDAEDVRGRRRPTGRRGRAV
ncbi:MAG: hypothetical protein U5R31_11200 [Acidimicrobiia bacterium]|nr:hypothetical protein [Acidimicrobiia bacterium]